MFFCVERLFGFCWFLRFSRFFQVSRVLGFWVSRFFFFFGFFLVFSDLGFQGSGSERGVRRVCFLHGPQKEGKLVPSLGQHPTALLSHVTADAPIARFINSTGKEKEQQKNSKEKRFFYKTRKTKIFFIV